MSFSVTILGCSSALPDPERNTSAQVIAHNDKVYLVDCGEGTQIQMRRFNVRFQKIREIFISHLHGDHFFGLIGLISSYSLLGRTAELNIYGPLALEEIIALQIRLTGMELTYPLNFHAIDPDENAMVFEDDRLQVYSLPMIHRIPTCGFLFREKQRPLNIRKEFVESSSLTFEEIRKIKEGADYIDPAGTVYPNAQITRPPEPLAVYAFCTDTAYNESLVPLIRDADLLYHEATFITESLPKAEARFHSTAAQAGMTAAKAGVHRLIIGHFSHRYRDLGVLLEEARQHFPHVELAEDGKCFTIR